MKDGAGSNISKTRAEFSGFGILMRSETCLSVWGTQGSWEVSGQRLLEMKILAEAQLLVTTSLRFACLAEVRRSGA